MLIRFFLMLRAAGVPASITEFLALLQSLAAGIIAPAEGLTAADQFYYLARAICTPPPPPRPISRMPKISLLP